MKPGEQIIFETAAGNHRGTVKKTWGDLAMVIVETEEYVRLVNSGLVKITEGEQTFYVPRRRVLAHQW